MAMAEAIIRVFPCDTKKEFETADDLSTWLLNSLKASGGKYRLRSVKGVGLGKNPPGSVVLFRHGNQIVGEAIVEKDITREFVKEGALTYEGFVKFSPSSIRIYVGGLPIEALGEIRGKPFRGARPYYRIEKWSLYPRILAEVIKKGFHYN